MSEWLKGLCLHHSVFTKIKSWHNFHNDSINALNYSNKHKREISSKGIKRHWDNDLKNNIKGSRTVPLKSAIKLLDNKNEIWRHDLQRGSKVITKVLEQMQTYAEIMTPNSTTNTI